MPCGYAQSTPAGVFALPHSAKVTAMKKLAILLLAAATLLSGCVVYDTPHRDGDRRGDYGRDGQNRGDRDGDGVPNRQDRRPGDPSRY
jgi:hypothetical protein